MKKKRLIAVGFALIAVIVMILSLTGLIEETLGVCIALAMTVIFTLFVAIMSYKSDIKILTVLMVIFMIAGLGLLGFNLYRMFTSDEIDKPAFTIEATEDDSEKKSIFTHDSHEYYTYHLREVKLTKDGTTYSLKDALEGGHVTLDDILSLAVPNENTSGYKIYYDGGSGGKDKYSIVVCDSGNVVFANYNYTYEPSICNRQ